MSRPAGIFSQVDILGQQQTGGMAVEYDASTGYISGLQSLNINSPVVLNSSNNGGLYLGTSSGAITTGDMQIGPMNATKNMSLYAGTNVLTMKAGVINTPTIKMSALDALPLGVVGVSYSTDISGATNVTNINGTADISGTSVMTTIQLPTTYIGTNNNLKISSTLAFNNWTVPVNYSGWWKLTANVDIGGGVNAANVYVGFVENGNTWNNTLNSYAHATGPGSREFSAVVNTTAGRVFHIGAWGTKTGAGVFTVKVLSFRVEYLWNNK